MIRFLSLTWKLVLKHVYLSQALFFWSIYMALSSKTSFETWISLISYFAFLYISYPMLYFLFLPWKLVSKNVYVTLYGLSSFPYSKTSFEACISLIPCFVFFHLKTSLVVFRLGVHRQVRVPIQLPLTREGFLASNSLSSQELVWKASSISNSILHRQELD